LSPRLFPPVLQHASARKQRKLRTEIRREVWRLTAIAWKAFCAALLPVRLADLPRILSKLLAHLAKYRGEHRPTALEKIRAKLADAAS